MDPASHSRRTGLPAAYLIVALFLSGCAQTQPPAIDESPIPTPSPPIPSARALSLADCDGVRASVDVPYELVQDDVPPQYSPQRTGLNGVAGTAALVVDLLACDNVTVDSTHLGAGSFSLLYTWVQTPPGTADSTKSTFIFEVRADQPDVLAWFGPLHLMNGTGTVKVTKTVQSNVDTFAAEMTDGTKTVYKAEGPAHGPFPQEDYFRHFYGPDPDQDFIEELKEAGVASVYVGPFEAAADSGYAAILDGFSPPGAEIVGIYSMSRNFTAPAVLE